MNRFVWSILFAAIFMVAASFDAIQRVTSCSQTADGAFGQVFGAAIAGAIVGLSVSFLTQRK